jgi:hypothetical protein
MAADDLMETVSGSFGIVGAADTVLVMAPTKTGGSVLDIRGRDVESAELAIQFSKDSCRWTILGAAAEIHQSEQRKKIIAALAERGAPMKITELMAATGMMRNPLELMLGRMVKDGLIKRVGSGLYAHNDYTPPPEPGGKSVPSVSPVSPETDGRQKPDRRHATDKTQENDSVCQSVSSVYVSADKAARPTTAAPSDLRVPTQTDQTDQTDRGAKTLSGLKNNHYSDLSPPQTDQTDQTEIPCSYCGKPGGLPVAFGEVLATVHPHCRDGWLADQFEGTTRGSSQ